MERRGAVLTPRSQSRSKSQQIDAKSTPRKGQRPGIAPAAHQLARRRGVAPRGLVMDPSIKYCGLCRHVDLRPTRRGHRAKRTRCRAIGATRPQIEIFPEDPYTFRLIPGSPGPRARYARNTIFTLVDPRHLSWGLNLRRKPRFVTRR